jgi:hypothetical protein
MLHSWGLANLNVLEDGENRSPQAAEKTAQVAGAQLQHIRVRQTFFQTDSKLMFFHSKPQWTMQE